MTHIVTNPRDDEIAEFRRLAAKLGHPTMPDLHVGVKLVDKDGKVLEDRYEQGHSWTRNAWSAFHNNMLDCTTLVAASSAGNTSYSKGNWGMRTTSGGFSQPGNNSYNFRQVGDSNSGYGLQVGTSNEPFSSEDFSLWGPITSGTSTGQLSYLNQSYTTPVLDAVTNTYSFTATRVFNNNSPGSIVVREVGLTTTSGQYLFTRDVLSSPINVPVGAQLTISVTVTSGSWAAIDATSVTQPALGAYTQGGIYLGPCFEQWGSGNNPAGGWDFPFNHTKYALICSTIAGDAVGTKQWRTTAAVTAGTQNEKDGSNNMAALYALGAGSPIGEFAAAANAAQMGGYSDWYVPARYEFSRVINAKALITGADALAQGNAYYWTSTGRATEANAWFRNPTDNGESYGGQGSGYRVRLVRRAKLTA